MGGQIGSGKTTLIQKLINSEADAAFCTFNFDRSDTNISESKTWEIVLAGLQEFIHSNAQELNNWSEQLRVLEHTLSENSNNKYEVFKNCIHEVLRSFGGTIVLVASGIDKFRIGSSGYLNLRSVLELLSSFKTLFEVNATHLFSQDYWIRRSESELAFITSISNEEMNTILRKRLGKLAVLYEKALSEIVTFSAGLPRQGIRLLDHFITSHRQKRMRMESIRDSIQNTNRDLFAFLSQPSIELLRIVHKETMLNISLLSDSHDSETAQKAIWGNWIIIHAHSGNSLWKADINPLAKIWLFPDKENYMYLEESEQKKIDEYSEKLKLSINSPNINSKFMNLLSEFYEKPRINLYNVFKILQSSLLSKNRNDRAIIAFKDANVASIVRAYLQAQSNSYDYSKWDHYVLATEHASAELLKLLTAKSKTDIYSIEFPQNISTSELGIIDTLRDTFIRTQMIWWIPYDSMHSYLEYWTQVRQIFYIIVLEEELQKVLSAKDLQSDIEYIQSINDGSNHFVEIIRNLEIVLEYLKKVETSNEN